MTKEMVTLAERIDAAYGTDRLDAEQSRADDETIHLLDTGQVRVCEKRPDGWHTHQWLKKAILLYFRIQKPEVVESGAFHFCDKIPVKSWNGTVGVRVVPQALARRGSFVEPGCILMPSFVNIGAYVGAGSMIDTWVTVGSCAQIGKNVHLAGGVGVGGVLEPLQTNPVIIEDNCFIGARSEVVEGVIVEENAVLGMGVFIGQSTKIYDRSTGQISYGRVPAGSVVVAGSLPSAGGNCQLYCAVIVKQVDAKTRAKTGINDLLRS